MDWRKWLYERELNEMSRKRTKLKNTTPPKEDQPMVIPGDMKVGTGPIKPSFRTGAHASKNKRRLKTRQNQNRNAIEEA